MEKPGYVYIMTNPNNTVFYTGATSSLKTRVYQHKEKLVEGFTKEFNCINLVYYEDCGTIYNAIVREKQIKGKTRAKKIQMIMELNPRWKDLYDTL